MSSTPVVVFITGAGRSGSTLLADLLGQQPDWFTAGEVRYLWARGLIQERLCGCGRAVPDCPVWSDVLRGADIDPRGPEVAAAVERQRAIDGLANVVRPFVAPCRSRLIDRLADHPLRLERLYRSIADTNGSKVVVDSSKLPTYGWVLDELTELDVRIVHLVRDPRATAYSWTRIKQRDTSSNDAPNLMHRMGPARSATLWTSLNLAAARRWSGRDDYVLVRYEDFVADPPATVARIAALAGYEPGRLTAEDDRYPLEPTHSVAGNPDRLRDGPIRIRPDDAWRRELSPARRVLVSTVTAPVRARFGY